MTGKSVFSAVKLLCAHCSLWDVAVVLLGLFIFSCLKDRFSNKGPMLWPMLGIIPSMVPHVHGIHNWITRALIKAGRAFHYREVWMAGAHGVMATDPSNVEYMLKTNFKNFPKGKYYRQRFHDLPGDGIFNADNDLWKEHRQIAISEMHTSRFVEHSFLTMQDLVGKKLLKLTEKLVKSGERFDLQAVLLRFTFDNICTAALEVDPGFLALNLPDIPLTKAFEKTTELTLFRFLIPPFIWKLMKFFNLGYEKRLKEATEVVHDFADKTVMGRRNQISKLRNLDDQSDLLPSIMDLVESTENGQQGNKKQHSTDKFFRDFCISIILAGRDTTSVALTWFFWLLNNNPEMENNILSEISEILGCRGCDNESHHDVIFTIDELKKMV